jgi:ribonuclease-3
VDPAGIAVLEARLGHRVRDRALLERALTHASWANEHPPALHQEPLALVGDAALGLAVAEHLFAANPGASVGDLTQQRAAIVSGTNLAAWAERLGVGALLRLGRGEDHAGGRARESILATTLEAVLGVLHVEGGPAAVRTAVTRLAGW